MDIERNEVAKPVVVHEQMSNQCSGDFQSTEIGSDSNCYLVNLCTKPSNHEIRHYLKGKCKILADLGSSQEVYGKEEEFLPDNLTISSEDMPNPKEVFWTDHGPMVPSCPNTPEIINVPPGKQRGNQKPYRITEIGYSRPILQEVVDESVYWRLDKPIVYGKEFDLLSTSGRKKAEEQIKKSKPDLIVAQWIGDILSKTKDHTGKEFSFSKRRQVRPMLQWMQEMWTWQKERGKLWMGEHPSKVQMWKEVSIRRMLNDSWSSEQPGNQMKYYHTRTLKTRKAVQ
jgi:hypothetical protein